MYTNYLKLAIAILLFSNYLCAQDVKSIQDSLYIQETEAKKEPTKVLHAEPLYIDLIRDLGARKGEREWNVGLGMTDKLKFDEYEALIEYEWAPIDRLGLEIELPFTFYSPINGDGSAAVPSNRLNGLQVAAQWSFYVNEKISTTMAVGYLNELQFTEFGNFGRPLIKGNAYSPFFIIAKRWGNNFHSLLYTGPEIEQNFSTNEFHTNYQANTSFHYMIPGTRNFVGVEFNKEFERNSFDMTMRPQLRVGISENLLIGIVAGIPINRENERLSSFLRLIWEPKHKF